MFLFVFCCVNRPFRRRRGAGGRIVVQDLALDVWFPLPSRNFDGICCYKGHTMKKQEKHITAQ